jgi:RNA polymerase sigma-70 factor (ECF subfamily)
VGEVERLVEAEFDRFVRIVAAVCGSVASAEDATATAFASAWEREQRGDGFTNLPGWVLTAALRRSRSMWRRGQAEAHAYQRMTVDRHEPADPDHAVDLEAALRKLPKRQQETVVLYYLLGFDVAAVAATLGISTGTVKTALSRARSKLAMSLAVREEVES